MTRVALWLAILIAVPGILYSLFGGVVKGRSGEEVRSLWRCVLISFESMTASAHQMRAANALVDFIGSLQFFIGVALLGLFGFTLANRLRDR